MDTLKNEFNEMVKLCEERVEEYGERASYFMEPATEEEIVKWEEESNVKIPEDYREWLKLTKTCQICSTIASLIFPQTKQSDFLPDDYVLIGYVVGDGEVLCFSKSTGKYITYFEGKVNEEYEDFKHFLIELIRMIKGERSISKAEKKMMLAKLKEIRERRNRREE